MSYLLRVALPDVPGSLGRLASAIGSAGGNIDAIEIVERTHDGRAVDDVFLAANTGIMPDSIISACTSLEDVDVLWISRYGAGSNLTRDLEVVEAMTTSPGVARDTLVDLLPAAFVVDWAARVRRVGDGAKVLHGTTAAPTEIPDDIFWPQDMTRGSRIEVPERLVRSVGGRVRARHRRDDRDRTPRWPRDPRLRDRAALAPLSAGRLDRPLTHRVVCWAPRKQVPHQHTTGTAGETGPPTALRQMGSEVRPSGRPWCHPLCRFPWFTNLAGGQGWHSGTVLRQLSRTSYIGSYPLNQTFHVSGTARGLGFSRSG